MSIVSIASKLRVVPRSPRSSDHAASTPSSGAPLATLLLDRDADVPIGVQLTWAIRTRIADGSISAGERLPGLRDLAQALGINANTVRAVYARLEREGLLESRQGSGTFVAAIERSEHHASTIAAKVAREARAAGIDPREVASALYVQGDGADPAKAQASRRSTLRTQIAALDQALGELEAEHPALARHVGNQRPQAQSAGTRARLPSATELEQVKSTLLRRIGEMQSAIDAIEQGDASTGDARKRDRGTAAEEQASAGVSKSRGGVRRARSRPATAGA